MIRIILFINQVQSARSLTATIAENVVHAKAALYGSEAFPTQSSAAHRGLFVTLPDTGCDFHLHEGIVHHTACCFAIVRPHWSAPYYEILEPTTVLIDERSRSSMWWRAGELGQCSRS